MADSAKYYVPAIAIQIPDGAGFQTSSFCSHITTLTFDGYIFSPATEIDYSKAYTATAGLTTKSYKIKKVPAEAGSVVGNLYDRIRYGHVEVFIYELEVDPDTDTVISGRMIIKGLLYKASSYLAGRIIDLEIKSDKYYFDKTGGVVCTEMCAVAYFGDKICKLPVTSVTGEVQSVTKTSLVLTGTPAGVTFIYNNGYIEFDGLRIKISYWESGATFSMSEIPPASWVGETVTIFIGCDKTLQACRVPHNNEINFFGLGYSMVDYNAMYEET